jgi:hypothetical protein
MGDGDGERYRLLDLIIILYLERSKNYFYFQNCINLL